MTSRELVEAAFEKKITNRIPVKHVGFSSRTASYILGREAFVGGGIQQWREAKSYWEGWHDEYLERSLKDAVDLALATGQDWIRTSYWRLRPKPTGKIDENTYLYETGTEKEWKLLRYYPESEQANFSFLHPRKLTLEDIRREVGEGEKRAASYNPEGEDFVVSSKVRGEHGDKVVAAGGVAIGIPIRNANIWLEAMILDPGLVIALINQQVEIARKDVEFLAPRGFRYFMGGSDFASEKGPMFSPRLFRELILPGLVKVSEICHKNKGYHLFASDGNLWPVADELFLESKIDGYYEVDRKAGMDLEKLRKLYPCLTLLGNISSWTLSRGSKEDVKRETWSCIEAARRYGGIIAGLSNYALPETPPENVEAMLDILINQ